MNACLIVLKPRQIDASERALAELPPWLPIIELVGYTEGQLADGVFEEALNRYPHDFYIVASDDLIIRWPAIEAIEHALSREYVTTGYCQFAHTDWRVNLTSRPLRGDRPGDSAYQFRTFKDVTAGDPTQQTWFTGMSLTAMSRSMWLEFPFGCFRDQPDHPGYSSDFHLSKRLQDAGVPIMAVRDAFAYHWRYQQAHTNDPRDDQVLVGQIEPEIRLR